MRGPPVFVVVKTNGDGYGHNSYEYLSWHFDEREADDRAKKLSAEHAPGAWYSVERVPAADPAPEKERW